MAAKTASYGKKGTSNHEIESPSAIPLNVADASAFLPMQLPAGRKNICGFGSVWPAGDEDM